MLYLSENEVGFDNKALGFPSIRGCHAIVYVTSNGLFGLHNYGGDLERDWPERSAALLSFFSSHPAHVGAVGKSLYGICYATTQRGYLGDKQKWKGELVNFANALGYPGKIYGYDLQGRGFPPPAYVHVEGVGDTCVVQVKPWKDSDSAPGVNPAPQDFQMIARNLNGVGYTLKPTKQQVVISVTTEDLKTVYPETLRG